MDPILCAGLISGGAKLLSSLFGGSSSASATKDTNRTNLRIAQETNALNERLFNQNLAWQEDMWNKTNAYNSPQNQVDMLLKAGINPASVMGNGSFSDATLPSAPSAPQMQGATMQAPDYSFIGQSFDAGVDAFFQSKIDSNNVEKGSADAQIAKVQADLDALTMMDRASKIANDASKSAHERETARLEMDFLSKTFNERVMQTSQLTQIQEQQFNEIVNRIAESKLHQESLRIANEYAPRLSDAQLKQYSSAVSELYARVAANYASANASNAVANNQLEQAFKTSLESQGVQIDNRVKDRVASAVVAKAKHEAEQVRLANVHQQNIIKSGKLYQTGGTTGVSGFKKVVLEPKRRLDVHRVQAKKVASAYDRGVKQGISKSKSKKSYSW